jgi:hypothetical protein
MPYIGKKPADIIATVIDTTTGTFSGDLTVDTNTLFVDSANNRVGVGTVSPSDLLELSGSTAQPAIRLNDTDVSGLYHRIFTPTNTGLAISADTGNVASDSFLRFDVDGSEVVRIDSSGNVGIGKTPTTTLDIKAGSPIIQLEDNDAGGAYSQINATGTAGSIIITADAGNAAANTHIALRVDGSERMRIDSSGNVGINDSGPEAKLHISENASGATYPILLQNRTNSNSSVGIRFIATGSDLSDGQFASIEAIGDTAGNTRHHLAFKTVTSGGTPAERMRITDGGNFLVGTTDTNVLANRGFAAKPQGSNNVRVDIGSNYQAMLLSTQNDGDIVGFYKDSTIVGSIGVQASQITIGNGSAGLRFHGTNADIYPWNMSTNAINNGGIDLGSAGGRFKDLYLSGGVYLGGTGSANKLDDYEEGTFTPTLVYSGTNTPTVNSALGTYTKIGQVVHVQIYFQWDENGSTGNLKAGALPFTSLNALNRAIPSMFSFGLTGLTENVSVTGLVQQNTTEILLFLNNNGASSLSATYTGSNQDLYITVTYTVA